MEILPIRFLDHRIISGVATLHPNFFGDSHLQSFDLYSNRKFYKIRGYDFRNKFSHVNCPIDFKLGMVISVKYVKYDIESVGTL